MPVTLLCPRLTCRAVLRVPDHVRGKHVRCAECGVLLLVPMIERPAQTQPKKRAGDGADEPEKNPPSPQDRTATAKKNRDH